MNDTTIIRTFLIETIATMPPRQEASAIEALHPFDHEGKIDAELFFENISKVLPWHLLNEIKNTPERAITSPGKMEVVVDVLLQARKLWQDGAKTSDFNNLITAFVIYDRVFMVPEEDLDWATDREGINRSVANLLKKMKISIELSCSSHSRFADKKYLSDFDTAVRTNNMPKIFDFFLIIDHGGNLYSDDIFLLQKISRFISIVSPAGLIQYSARCNILTQRIILLSIPMEHIPSQVDAFQVAGILAQLIILKDYFDWQNDPRNRTSEPDLVRTRAYVKIIEAISKHCQDSGPITFICKTLNVKPNDATNTLFSAYVAMHQEHVIDYVNNIDFAYDNSGDVAYKMHVELGNEKVLDLLSAKIAERYFEFLVHMDYRPNPFIFTSYYNFLLRTVSIETCGQYGFYLDRLESASIAVARILSSWKTEEVPIAVTKWIFWIMAIKQLKYVIHDLGSSPFTQNLLSDKKFMRYLSKRLSEDVVIDFGWLGTFLTAPETIDTIDIYHSDKHLQIHWSSDSDS